MFQILDDYLALKQKDDIFRGSVLNDHRGGRKKSSHFLIALQNLMMTSSHTNGTLFSLHILFSI
jgi:hypothetical protein